MLEDNRSPSRKSGELDNRGTHFYLALYWSRALADQDEDSELAERFAPLARKLADSEEKILDELSAVQGSPADIGGYYRPDLERATAVMRPSQTLNDVLANFSGSGD
jgi:isocitrate dehydrogenase